MQERSKLIFMQNAFVGFPILLGIHNKTKQNKIPPKQTNKKQGKQVMLIEFCFHTIYILNMSPMLIVKPKEKTRIVNGYEGRTCGTLGNIISGTDRGLHS